MRKWLEDQWKPLIGYTPIISRLMKEWYCFHFLKASDLEAVFKSPWVCGRRFLALFRWYIGLDPLKNTPTNNLIWVKLPNLPLEMWSMESLTEIGNSIDKFVYVDPLCKGENDKRITWILIEKVYKGGHPDHIEIAWVQCRIKQRLDFWGIPFRCSSCHKTGHLIKNCRRHPILKPRLVHRRLRVDSSLPLSEKLSSSSISLPDIDHMEKQVLKNPESNLS